MSVLAQALVQGADGLVEQQELSGALILFEADFRVGTRVQLMDIDPQRMIDSLREQTEPLLADLGDATPEFGLYIDCVGRARAFAFATSGCRGGRGLAPRRSLAADFIT